MMAKMWTRCSVMPYAEAFLLTAVLFLWVLLAFLTGFTDILPYRTKRGRFVKMWIPLAIITVIYAYTDFPNNTWSKGVIVSLELIILPLVIAGMILASIDTAREHN